MKLGVLYKDGQIVNHRSLLKVLLNPILRRFGYYIGTICENNKLKGLKIGKCEPAKKIKWDFNSYNEHDTIIRKRIFI